VLLGRFEDAEERLDGLRGEPDDDVLAGEVHQRAGGQLMGYLLVRRP
jgi:hypothetical protein